MDILSVPRKTFEYLLLPIIDLTLPTDVNLELAIYSKKNVKLPSMAVAFPYNHPQANDFLTELKKNPNYKDDNSQRDRKDTVVSFSVPQKWTADFKKLLDRDVTISDEYKRYLLHHYSIDDSTELDSHLNVLSSSVVIEKSLPMSSSILMMIPLKDSTSNK
jgi:hypothetical protein